VLAIIALFVGDTDAQARIIKMREHAAKFGRLLLRLPLALTQLGLLCEGLPRSALARFQLGRFTFSQCRLNPLAYPDIRRFDTTPSNPKRSQ